MHLLLNPGPVSLTEGVRQSLLQPDLCHREPEFAELVLDIKKRLQNVYPGCPYDPVLLTGSGSAAVEAMLSTFAPRDGRTLVVAHGVYGERIAQMLERGGKPFRLIKGEWLRSAPLDAVRQALSEESFTHVAAVHHETTTGRLNPLAPLMALCRQFNAELLLDAVSSFGAEPIPWSAPLTAVAATANKCLHGVPGVSFVMVRPGPITSHAGSLYLDLAPAAAQQASGWSPFTMAVHVCYALQQALRELETAGGVEQRRRRYEKLSLAVRDSLARLGVEALLPAEENSSMLTAYRLPPQGYAWLHDGLKQAGFVIYAGQGDLAKDIFRIAVMGDLTDLDLQRLQDSLRKLLQSPS